MGWFRNLFRGRPEPPSEPPPPDMRHLGENFRRGDLAECIADRWLNNWPNNPKQGDVLRVSGVYEGIGSFNELAVFLRFEGKPQQCGWRRDAFRKIVHLHTKADLTIEEMIKGKKVVERTP